MNGHHLILGKQIDYLTGETIADTHDERYRQDLAKQLVEKEGYKKSDLLPRRKLTVTAGGKSAQIQIDLTITLDNRVAMIIRYGPGSLVTRHRPSIAASRVMTSYQVPLVVVTNGRDADVLDGKTGRVLARGIASIPSRQTLFARIRAEAPEPISPERAQLEQRILYAYDVDDSCPCDDSICKL